MPERSCIICRCKNEKKDLLRIVADQNCIATLDTKQNINSRGIYICNNKECLTKCKKLINNGKFRTKINIDNQSLEKVIDNIIELEE